jgi:hypothetical protein
VEAALDAVKALVKQGRYQDAKVRNRWISGSFAAARMAIVQGGREHDSFVFVTVHDGMFVKIRLSTSSGDRAQSLAQRFLEDYRRTLEAASSRRAGTRVPTPLRNRVLVCGLTGAAQPGRNGS